MSHKSGCFERQWVLREFPLKIRMYVKKMKERKIHESYCIIILTRYGRVYMNLYLNLTKIKYYTKNMRFMVFSYAYSYFCVAYSLVSSHNISLQTNQPTTTVDDRRERSVAAILWHFKINFLLTSTKCPLVHIRPTIEMTIAA